MTLYLKSLLLPALLLMASYPSHAQYVSDYEVVKGRDDQEIVYKGTVTFDDLSTVEPFHLETAAASYKENADAQQSLAKKLPEYDLMVFLGTWCEDSHRMIPPLFRVLKDASYPFEKLTLQAVDRDKKSKGSAAGDHNIQWVPTIIVIQHGQEIGRITEVADKSVEQDLLKIIVSHEK